ncbi:MAG: diaminopimelate epimerase [candidate division Zixibacteria bacterium]|nr:diaminopimelate epimerase [candidate division Zixibacteria bacterium]
MTGLFALHVGLKQYFDIMKKIAFKKFHCLGNDFIVVDLIGKRSTSIDFNDLTENICNRNIGIGADGVLVLRSSRKCDCFLDIFNSDGSWAEKSGNGLRITAAYLALQYKKKSKVKIETECDSPTAQIIKSGMKQSIIKVSLGEPEFETKKVPLKSKQKFHINSPIKIDKHDFVITALSVGNPHAVLFVDNFDFDWRFLGNVIENSKLFPNRTNVEFVKIVSRSKVKLNDWERGAGATGSSGTGAAAAAVAGIINGFLNRKVEVVFPGGSLHIEWTEQDKKIFLTGPVEYICQGEYLLV